MPRPTPTTNPYMWDDVKSYLLKEDIKEGIELEDNSGYIMLEHWNNLGPAHAEDFEDILTRDIITVRKKVPRRRTWPTNL